MKGEAFLGILQTGAAYATMPVDNKKPIWTKTEPLKVLEVQLEVLNLKEPCFMDYVVNFSRDDGYAAHLVVSKEVAP